MQVGEDLLPLGVGPHECEPEESTEREGEEGGSPVRKSEEERKKESERDFVFEGGGVF